MMVVAIDILKLSSMKLFMETLKMKIEIISKGFLNILATGNLESGNRSSGTQKSTFLCLIICPFLWKYSSRPCRLCGA